MASKILLLCGLLLTIQSLNAQGNVEQMPLYLKSGNQYLTKNIQEWINDLPDSLIDQDKVWPILQFNSIPNQEQRNQLKAEGIELLQFLPKNAYLASVSVPANQEALAAMGVRAFYWLKLADRTNLPNHIGQVLGMEGQQIVLELSIANGMKSSAQSNLESMGAEMLETRMPNMLKIKIDGTKVLDIFQMPYITYLSESSEEYQVENRENRQAQGVSPLHSSSFGLDGSGVVVGVGDNNYVDEHIDLLGRNYSKVAKTTFITPAKPNHAVHVSGTIAGAGNENPIHMGMAPKAYIINDYFGDMVATMPQLYLNYRVSIGNNSWSQTGFNCGNFGDYTSSSSALDQRLNEYNKVLQVFSAMNEGTALCNGVPNNYRNLAYGYNISKNVLTVGAASHKDTITDFSSRGPARDGRLKPEIMATGFDVISCKLEDGYVSSNGTSMSAPTVSGIAALLTQRYKQLNAGSLPDAALLKSLLCNTAKDMGNAGPDYQYGFGIANAYRALQVLNNGQYASNTIANNATQTQTISVGNNVAELKVMLYWSDKEGSSNSQFALVNDLDLEIIDPNNNVVLPWTLDHTIANVANLATRTRDSINNIEQVTIQNPIQGNYTIRVKGTSVAFGPQTYYTVYDVVEKGITVTYPFGDEKWVPGETEYIRWDAFGTGNNTFKIEYSTNGGNTWSTINAAVADSLRYYAYTVPSVATHEFRIKVSVNNTAYADASDLNVVVLAQTLLTASDLGSGAAYVSWNSISGASRYHVLHFNNGNWDTIKQLSGTSDTLKNLPADERVWLSVEPEMSNGTKGRRSISKLLDLSSGTCPWPRDIEIVEIVSPDHYGRLGTSDSMTSTDVVSVKVRNVGNNDLDSFQIGFVHDFWNAKTETVRQFIGNGNELTVTFTNTIDNSFAWQHDLTVWASAFNDTRTSNDSIKNYTIKHRDNWGAFLPYKEDFEFWVDTFYMGYNPSVNFRDDVDFLSSSTQGRLTVEQLDDLVVSGNRSVVLDKNRSILSSNSQQVLQYTLNMSAYKDSSVYLSFNYKTFGDGGETNDAIFVRGNDTCDWLKLYQLVGGNNGALKQAKDLNISSVLAANNQEFTTSFQLRFSQYGSGATTTSAGSDGIAFDDIEIYQKSPDLQAWSIESQTANTCYSSTETIVLKLVNLSSRNLQNIPVAYSINGGQAVSETINSINAFDTIIYSFNTTANFSNAGNYTIDAWVNFGPDTTSTNDSVTGHQFFATKNVSTFPYYQSFENDNGYWISDNIVWQWGTSNQTDHQAASNGTKYWATGLNVSYGFNHTSYLVSPCFNLSALGNNVLLAFNQKREMAQGDQLYIEYSEDGQTWTKLGAQGSGLNWYNHASNYWFGDTTSWHTSQIQVPMGAISDKSAVRFRFVIAADAANSAYGWQIDEVFVGEIGNDIELVSIENTIHACGRSNAETFTVKVANHGSSAQTNVPVRYQIDAQNVVQETINSISAGDTITYQFSNTANFSSPNTYTINAWVDHTGDNYVLNDSVLGHIIYSHEQFSTNNFYENFETDNGNWLIEGERQNWEWGTPNYGDLTTAGEGSKAWVTGLNGGYWHNYEGYLYTGCFDLSNYTSRPYLSFQLFKELGPTTDHFLVEYSEDQINWTKLGENGQGGNWYNNDNDYWSGREAIWKQVYYDFPLNTLSDSSKVQFRFVLNSDQYHTDDGIGIDSFVLKELGKDVQLSAILNPANGENIGLSATTPIQVVVKNNSNQTLQNIAIKYQANGGNVVSQNITQLTAHQTDTVTFNTSANLSAIGLQSITAYTDYANDADQSNDTVSFQFRNIQKVTSYPYKADFESNNNFYAEGTLSSWERGVPSDTRINAAAAGTKAWVTDLNNNHNQGEQSYLYTPAFDLSAMNGDAWVRFYFYRYLNFGSNATLEYSDNNGQTWIRLGSTNTSQNWYNSLNAWSGFHVGWLQTQHLIPTGSINNLEQVRFRFKLDASSHFSPSEGFAIDEFEVFELVDDVELVQIVTPNANETQGQKSIQVKVANNMSTALTNVPVKYQLDNNSVVTEAINSISANDTATLTFSTQINLSSFGTFNLKVWTDKNTDTYTSNDTQEVDITVLNVVSSFPYYEGFENNNGNWQTSGNLSTWEWGAPANTEISEAAHGTKAWVTDLDGVTNRNEVSYLTSPLFDMRGISGNPTFSFYHRFNTISLHKHYVEYTEDGNAWTKFGQNGSGTNWYNHASHYWNNSNSDWEQAEYVFPLSTLSNKANVRIRFVYENDAFNQKEGVGIDDIFIGHKGTDIQVISVTAPDTSCGLSNAETLTISVQNLSSSATGAFNVHYQLNGGNTVTEQMPSISANSTASFSFSTKANVSATGTHSFKVWHSLSADNYPVNDTFNYQVVNASSVSNFPYSENFENGNGGWYTDGSGTWEWTTPANTNLSSAASGSKAWVTDADGNVPKSSTMLLYSPCFDMSGFGANPTLSFNLARHLQWGVKLWVEYSEDGNTWTKLGQNGSGQNWYDNAGDYWTQTATSFSLASYEIPVSSMSVKTSVRLRFVAQCNPWTNSEGLVIDDVNIQNIANDVEAVAFDMPTKGAGLGNETVTVQVKNKSSTTQNNVYVYYKLNNNAAVKDTIPSITSGQTINFNFTAKADMSATTTHQLLFYTDHSTDNYAVNDTVSGFEVVNIKYITSYPYFEDFETDNGTFYAEGWNSTWEHGVPSSNNAVIKRAASGTKAWVTNLDGGYDASESSFLRSPYFDLSGFSSNPIIALSIIHKLEWDPFVYIQYSEDGQQWNSMPATTSGKNWQQFGFSQNRTHWQVVSTEIPLSSMTDKDSVQFRVWFDAGFGFDVYDGFGIDNFHIHEKAEMHDGNTVKNISQSVSGNGWVHFSSNGKRVVSIHPQGENLGNTSVTAYVNTSGNQHFANQYLLDRSWVIEPTNQPSNPVKVRLYMLDTEIESLRSASGCQNCTGIDDAFKMGITKYHGNNQDSTLANNTSGNYTWIGGNNISIRPYGRGYCAEFTVTSFSEFFGSGGGVGGNTPLPVELNHFSAQWQDQGKSAQLTWQTAQEINNSHFEIERSLDGQSWETIGRVEGAGNSLAVHSYQFIDHSPQSMVHSSLSTIDHGLSTVFYRLKQIDYNGAFEYSETRTLNLERETRNSISIYPNPAKDQVHIVTEGSVQEVKIYNLYGQLVMVDNRKLIDVSALPAGHYIVETNDGSRVYQEKLLKQ